MENAVSTLSQFHTSKADIARYVEQVVSEIKGGVMNPLTAKLYIKSLQKSLKEIEEQIDDDVMSEAGKYVEQSFEYRGAQIDKVELGTKYDFTNCNDKEWNELDMNIKELSEKKKIVEGFLKSLKEPINLFNENTGETWTVSPPIKTSTSGIKVTIR